MHERSIYRNLSPLDHRYLLANQEEFERLSEFLSEDGVIRSCVQVEAALLEEYIDYFFEGDSQLISQVRKAVDSVTPDEVYAEEENTQHNIRALVNVLNSKLPEKLKPYVHLGATSVDILDTAQAIRFRGAVRSVLLPLLIEIENELLSLAEKEADTLQIGRTHGQHAVPVTFGFAVSEYVARLGKAIQKINTAALDLRGKLAGAVGAYNATSLLVEDPIRFEKDVLQRLKLKPGDHSTQLVEPEYLARLMFEIQLAFGILANLADDLRHLQRSEIAEVQELFRAGQVGSSTMPQKRNPWNSEHVKSLWKAFSPRIITVLMDQISEHQRDLTNSASSRFLPEIFAGLTAAAVRMRKILQTLRVDSEKMQSNAESAGDLPLSEAAYILLAASGKPDAHESIKQLTLLSQQNNTRLFEEIQKKPEIRQAIEEMLKKVMQTSAEEFFSVPENYRGRASDKTQAVVRYFREILKSLPGETT
ncbi:MAG: adenylosuccinate lyase [Spirochaetales bacterium]|nr:adenylosuccinate lyase [Spirochaetales bacterium]